MLVDDFLAALSAYRRRSCFNPWAEDAPDQVAQDGPKQRRDRLRLHLSISEPRLVLLGEAPGHKGARISGLAFTSEDLLMKGKIPRVPKTQRLSSGDAPLKEISATVVWSKLFGIGVAEQIVMFNCFP